MIDPLHLLPTASLQSLAGSLESGLLAHGISRFGVQQAAGSDAADVERSLHRMVGAGFSLAQVAVVVRAIVETRRRLPDVSSLIDLVLTGPDLPGVPTADTAAAMHTLVSTGTSQILMVGYAVHNGREVFERLANRMNEISQLSVTFCLDIGRPFGDGRADEEIVRQFAAEFRTKHWPWQRLPKVFFDPRALEAGPNRASLHAKCVVVDSSVALVTSANFTEAAQHRNIEAGVIIKHSATATRLSRYFEGLIQGGILRQCELPK